MASNVSNILASNSGDELNLLVNLLSSMTGKTSNTTTTKTTGADVSPDALNAIIKRGLEEAVPGISAGAKSAGLYNSTTNSLLMNDLQARLAAEAAKLSTKNTETIKTANETPAQISPKTLGTGIGAGILAKQLLGGGNNSILGSLINPVLGIGGSALKKLGGSLFEGDLASALDPTGVGSTAVNLPQVFDTHPIFSGDGLPVAGMGFNDPAATAIDLGGGQTYIPAGFDTTFPIVDTSIGDLGIGDLGVGDLGGQLADTSTDAMPNIGDASWLMDNFGDMQVPQSLLDLGAQFDLDPTNLSGAGLDAINNWISENLGGVMGTGVDVTADAAGQLADSLGGSILDMNWW